MSKFNIPNTLNGYPVLMTAQLGTRDLVIVHRPQDTFQPFVLGTWDGNDAWVWGHYFETLKDALTYHDDISWNEYVYDPGYSKSDDPLLTTQLTGYEKAILLDLIDLYEESAEDINWDSWGKDEIAQIKHKLTYAGASS